MDIGNVKNNRNSIDLLNSECGILKEVSSEEEVSSGAANKTVNGENTSDNSSKAAISEDNEQSVTVNRSSKINTAEDASNFNSKTDYLEKGGVYNSNSHDEDRQPQNKNKQRSCTTKPKASAAIDSDSLEDGEAQVCPLYILYCVYLKYFHTHYH